MSDTPETDKRVKDNKHIRFLEEDHWSLNGKFTYTHPIVALCRRLERERDEARAVLVYEQGGIHATAGGWAAKYAEAIEQRDRLAEALRERDEALIALKNYKAQSIHTCHDQCQQPMCVLRRERDEARALADRLANELLNTLSAWIIERDAEQAVKALTAVEGGPQ